jgi:NADPH:quinone reductase-like Zn-dependent oxidoreductase
MVGTVIEVNEPSGSGIGRGDRVIATPVIGCGYCEYCSIGEENKCDRWRMLGFQVDGTYREKIVLPVRQLIKVPHYLNDEEAASLPLSLLVSWRALRTLGDSKPGNTVLIWGASGGTGTTLVKLSIAMGLRTIAVSRSRWKADKLSSIGADLALAMGEDDIEEEVMRFTSGRGVDLVIDYIGSQTLQKSIKLARKGGKIIVFGVESGANIDLNIRMLYLSHISLIGTHTGSRGELIKALEFIESKKITPIIDKVFSIDNVVEAHRYFESYKHFGKVVLKIR